MPRTKELIKGCQNGDRKSQYQLYQQFSSGMMAVAMRYSKSTQEAEDILQEGFIKIFQNIKNSEANQVLDIGLNESLSIQL